MTISYIDKTKRRQTCVCLLLSGWPKRPVAKSFHPFAKIQPFSVPTKFFSQLFFVSITSFLLYLIPQKQELKKGDRNYRLLRI